ncbi:hypothetical protein [Roseibium album]|uniref:hypothetical protein n=1 Tax=Roseibium album TaxID=311410 RepID=UPI002492C4FD|nr:hypothetical protein [Roseibium album]
MKIVVLILAITALSFLPASAHEFDSRGNRHEHPHVQFPAPKAYPPPSSSDAALMAVGEAVHLLKNAQPGDIAEAIIPYGYSWDATKELFGDTTYNVQQIKFGPGEVGFFATPTSELSGANSVYLAPGTAVIKAGLFGYSGEDIKEAILEGIKLSLEASCGFPVRPSKITATASAAVLSLQLEWESSEVCDRLDEIEFD